MNISKILKDTLTLELKGETKQEIIEELVDIMMRTGCIKSREDAVDAVIERERKMSTGMQNGIAIPHGKSDTVDCLVAAMGIKKEGTDFQSLDGEPAYIFIATLSPANRTGPHIQFLAEVSRLLSSAEVRERILNSKSTEELYEIMASS